MLFNASCIIVLFFDRFFASTNQQQQSILGSGRHTLNYLTQTKDAKSKYHLKNAFRSSSNCYHGSFDMKILIYLYLPIFYHSINIKKNNLANDCNE